MSWFKELFGSKNPEREATKPQKDSSLDRPTKKHADKRFSGYTSSVHCLAFSPNGQQLASGHVAGDIVLWNLESGQVLRNLQGQRAATVSLAFSPDGFYLASGSYDSTARIWEVETGREICALQANVDQGRSKEDVHVAFSPDGNLLATGSLNVKLWDARTAREIQVLPEWDEPGWNSGVAALRFSSDGTTLAVGAKSFGHVRHYKVPEGTKLRRLDPLHKTGGGGGVSALAFAADLRTFAWGFNWRGGNWVKLWETDSEEELCTFAATHERGMISQVTFSPDDQRVASADVAGYVRHWDIFTKRELSVTRRPNRVYAIEFSPDGQTLAYAGEEKTIGFIQKWIGRRQER